MGYRPALDGIRAIAVLLVILVHALPSALPGGHMGVDVFFALSGFLITKLLMEEFDRQGTISLKKFYLRRALRLLPALVLLLVVHQAILASWAAVEGAPYPRRQDIFDVVQVLFYFANWTRAFDYHPSGPLGHCWSLSIEEQYYLVWPLIALAVLSRTRNRPGVRVASCVVLGLALTLWRVLLTPQATAARIYNGLDTRADILILGSCAGIAIHHYGRRIQTWIESHGGLVRAFVALCLLFFVYALRVAKWHDPSFGRVFLTAFALLLPPLLLVLVCRPQGPIDALLSKPRLVYVGRISYGVYLWHFPLFVLYMPMLGLEPEWRLPVGLPLTLLLAHASHRFVERPMLARKKRLVI